MLFQFPRWQKMMTWLISGVAIYALILLLMFIFQRHIMYFPNKNLAVISSYGIDTAKEVTLKTPDGAELIMWSFAAAENMPTLLHYHGNAGNLSDRTEVYTAYHKAGFGVMALSWRGYGRSTGKPNEQGLYIDARTLVDYALNEQQIPASKIIFYGESLGTGVAIQMATEFDVAGVVLEAPYTSITERAQEMYPWVPVPWLIKDHYKSAIKIVDISEPLMIFHNRGDRIVPFHHGESLFKLANEPKVAHWMESKEHVVFDREGLAQKMLTFFEQQGVISVSEED